MVQNETIPDEHRLAERLGFIVDDGREEIIFGETLDWSNEPSIVNFGYSGHIRRDGLTLSEVEELLDHDYMSLKQHPANGPSPLGDLLGVMREAVHDIGVHEGDIRLSGGVVSPYRNDSRIRFDTIYYTGPPSETVLKLMTDKLRGVDKWNNEAQYSAWWD